MDSSTHPRFDPDYWEWPGKVVAYRSGSSFNEILEIVSTKPDANPWILFKISYDGTLDAITFVLDDKENEIYALYAVNDIDDWAGKTERFKMTVDENIKKEDYQQVAKIMDDIVDKNTGLSLQGLWASLSEYASPTYENIDDIRIMTSYGNNKPLILFQAIPKVPHSINKRKIE